MAKATLPDHVSALMVPSAHAHKPEKVELIQTHISYVLLAGDEVYKLKKPVNFGFLDFSSLEKRRVACEAEVRLNRRACGGIYLGVEPVMRGSRGFQFGGKGEVIDYAVHMKRLPRDRMMDALLEADAVTLEMIDNLVGRLVHFHAQSADDQRLGTVDRFEVFKSSWQRNLDIIEEYVGRTLSRRRFSRISGYAANMLADQKALLRLRESEGRVRDCHGDLRSDSVCIDEAFEDGICLVDCIEFDEQLRISDTGLEIGFLAMDLDFRGRPELADLLTGLYAAATNDQDLPRLSNFFKCYRACVRGLVESLTGDRPEIVARQRGGARRRAREYFRLAESYSRTPATPLVVLMMGLSGSGKSFQAGSLASRLGVALLGTDMARLQLHGRREPGQDRDEIGRGRYAVEERDRVYDLLAQQAEICLADGRGVVIDGTYIERDQRIRVRDLAVSKKRPVLVVECQAPEARIRERQRSRMGQDWAASEGRWEVYEAQRDRYQPPDEFPLAQRVVIDTTLPLAEQIELVFKAGQRLFLAG